MVAMPAALSSVVRMPTMLESVEILCKNAKPVQSTGCFGEFVTQRFPGEIVNFNGNLQTLRFENCDLFRVLHCLLCDYGWRTDCHVTVG